MIHDLLPKTLTKLRCILNEIRYVCNETFVLHFCWFNFDALAQGNAYKPTKEPINYRGPGGDRTHDLQTEATPPAASCPARTLHATEIAPKNATPMTCPWLHWTTDNPSGMHRCQFQHLCVNFELRPGAGDIHFCWFNFDALAQGNAYKPTKEPINYRGPGGDRTHDLQTEATPPAASCPARTLHATEIAPKNATPMTCPWLHWTTDNPSGMHRCQFQHLCVNFELRPGAGDIHFCWFNFDALAQGNAYKPTKEPINYRGPGGDRTHDLQTEATPPAASCPARTLHATEIAPKNATPMTCPWLHWTTDNPSGMHRCQFQHLCVNFELRPGAGDIHFCWFNFDALAQGNAYKPTKEPINYRGPGGDRTHDLQTEATPPAASCPARTLHATEIAPKNATPMTCPWLHWTTDNPSGMHRCQFQHLCVNFELRPGAGDIHFCWFNFDALAQGNAYKPTKEPINYRGPGGDRTHDLQTEATPPAASCPARTLHATEIAPKNATPMTCPWLHWTTDNPSGMHRCQFQHLCVNFELRPGAGDIHFCWFNFDALAQGNAYKPTKEPINYRGPGGDRTHDLQTEATPPAASCPARTLHATEIAPKNATPMTCPWLHWTTDNP